MKLLASFDDNRLNNEKADYDRSDYSERRAARAVVIDKNNGAALLYSSHHNNYKLAGGGLDKNEDIKQALHREILEELGVEAEVIGEIGQTEEYWDKIKEHQISYCFLAKTNSREGTPHFTDGEIAAGFEARWFDSLDEAIEEYKNCKPKTYEGRFVKMRDLIFLEEAIKTLKL